jgi:hypothetical protein
MTPFDEAAPTPFDEVGTFACIAFRLGTIVRILAGSAPALLFLFFATSLLASESGTKQGP